MTKMLDFGLRTLAIRGDKEGKLVAIEENTSVPFKIRRVFTIFESSPYTVRGEHANRRSSFAFQCVAGSCRVRLLGQDREVLSDEVLSSASQLLWIGPMVWKEMSDFSKDCVLVVLSDQLYDPEEYVYEFAAYDAYLKGR